MKHPDQAPWWIRYAAWFAPPLGVLMVLVRPSRHPALGVAVLLVPVTFYLLLVGIWLHRRRRA